MLALSVFGAQVFPPIVTPFEAKIGFRPLFDGRTTTGWKVWRGTGVPGAWRVEGGELTLKSGQGPGGDLSTVEQFANFELRLEWRIAPRGNSGIIYRAGEEYPEGWKTGPEFQVLDDFGLTGGRTTSTSAASLYEMFTPHSMVTRPAGQWNDARVVARGNRLQHWSNHVKVVDCEVGSEDWNARYGRSKFRAFPEFARKQRGFIVLQDHGAEVSYRRIRIREF